MIEILYLTDFLAAIAATAVLIMIFLTDSFISWLLYRWNKNNELKVSISK